MKIKIYLGALLLNCMAVLLGYAQTAVIRPVTLLRGLQAAKTENKYLLVIYDRHDAPRDIETKIFTNDSVARELAAHFIVIRIQTDTSANDNDQIKSDYSAAQKLRDEYNFYPSIFPVFLFFSADGKAVSKAYQFKEAPAFLAMLHNAQNPQKQYYTLLERYRQGKANNEDIYCLTEAAALIVESQVQHEAAKAYVEGYLDKLSFNQFLQKKYLDFTIKNCTVLKPNDQVFRWCLSKAAVIDSAEHQERFAQSIVNVVAHREVIVPAVDAAKKSGKTPDWAALRKQVTMTYGMQYGDNELLAAKVYWYRFIKNGPLYAHYLTEQTKRQITANQVPENVIGVMMLNNNAYDIFQFDQDQKDLEAAIRWVDVAIKIDGHSSANLLDTKATLLYKLGKKTEALQLEGQAAEQDPKNKDIREDYEKMKSGQQLWPDKMP